MSVCGLSPRVRGNLQRPQLDAGSRRSIPACAGEPCGQPSDAQHQRVYPRVCGGTLTARMTEVKGRGLSPRVRGNLLLAALTPILARSIPACAGEPVERMPDIHAKRVYPRVCGGTSRVR